MNKLPTAKRVQILSMLVEGASMRSISRVADVSINTVAKLLAEAGEACIDLHDANVRGVKSRRIQCDEIWSFCHAKKKNVESAKAAPEGAGDLWTWTALDADSKLIVSFLVGSRDAECANAFMQDTASRLANEVHLTSDNFKTYLDAVEGALGGDINYGILVKIYGETHAGAGRYTPAECTGPKKERGMGILDPRHISTGHIERQSLTMRMHMRRLTQLTKASSKKVEPHVHMVSLYTVWYNYVRQHKALRCSPAMAAGLSKTLWSLEDIVALIDAKATAPARPECIRPRAEK